MNKFTLLLFALISMLTLSHEQSPKAIPVALQVLSTGCNVEKVYRESYASHITDMAGTFVLKKITGDIYVPHFTAKVKLINIGNNASNSIVLNANINSYNQQMSGIGNLNSLENDFTVIPDFTDLKLEADKGKNTIEIKLSKISETKKENLRYTTSFKSQSKKPPKLMAEINMLE